MKADVDLSPDAVRQIQDRLIEWGIVNFRDFPWRHSEDPYVSLVTEVLLQRTRAASVSAVFDAFFEAFPTPHSLAQAGVGTIAEAIHPLGLRWRAPLLKALGERLVDSKGIPEAYDELLDLPAIGPYAASAWISFHAGGRGVLVDSNVVRWICRLLCREYDAETRRRRWIMDFADRLTPLNRVREYNYAVLDFSMSICTPSEPKCELCPLGAELCCYGRKRLGADG